MGVPAAPRKLNKFAYAIDDPINYSDPSGLEDLSSLSAASSGEGILSQAVSTATNALGQQFKEKLVCEAGELMITGGVYIFVEEVAGGLLVPYIGQGQIGARIAAHEAEARIFGQFFAYVELGGGEAARRAAEQVLINQLSGFLAGLPPGWRSLPTAQRRISNLINSVSPKRWLPFCAR